MDSTPLLAPQPRSCSWRNDAFDLAHHGDIALRGEPTLLLPALQVLTLDFGPHWRVAINPADATWNDAAIRLSLGDVELPVQGYILDITSTAITAKATSAAGLYYAAMTLRQLRRVCGTALPACRIEDWPDFPVRGVMLDISRDKVPTMSTLFLLVDQFAEWKINQLELYTEHTFAYHDHPEVWQDASPMTAEEIRSLDAYCRSRCVDLVPNQNSFGHFERWLKHPRYNDLAECPQGGAKIPWGGVTKGPCGLNPTDPRSLALLRELYAELLPNFSSRFFNVGCDETFDLGQGRCKDIVTQRGAGRVYLDFLLKINELVRSHGRTMTFWGDIIMHHPELVPELPQNLIALEWGYESSHPFADHGAKFAASGIPFFVCPGTSAWSSLAGRTTNMRDNLLSAAKNGLRHGAIGFLNTDWGDNGHWQTLPVSYPGFLFGAALSWCHAANADLALEDALNRHAFADEAGVLGKLTLALGDAYRLCGGERGNSTELFQILFNKLDRAPTQGVTTATLVAARAVADDALALLSRAKCKRHDAAWLTDETAQTARLLQHACNRGIAILDGSIQKTTRRRELATELDAVIAGHECVWLRRNRPGGFRDSAAPFHLHRAEYLA